MSRSGQRVENAASYAVMKRPAESASSPLGRSHDITQLLHAASSGQSDAFDTLITLLYDELSILARQRLRHESKGHTLNTTGLVHETYLKLVGQTRIEWRNREQFFAVASEAMRRILIDHARRRQREKRGGAAEHIPLRDDLQAHDALLGDEEAEQLLSLDTALTRLAEFNPGGARIVQLRFFGGLSNGEVADLLDSSERTVRRTWSLARAWLRRDMASMPGGGASVLPGE